MSKLIALLLLIVSSVAFSSPSALHNIVIFGDSLSDTGNLYAYMDNEIPSSPPYFSGRFSNGPVWVELLADKAFPGEGSAHTLDYAYGGAAVETEIEDEESLFSLKHEVLTYLKEHETVDSNSLFLIWIGANNYLSPPEGVSIEDNTSKVTANIRENLVNLIEHGAKHIAIINLPDLSRTPFGLTSTDHQILAEEVLAHNQKLLASFDELKQHYPQVKWFYFDAYSEVNAIIDNPIEYGFNNVTLPCYETQMRAKSRKSLWIQFAFVKKSADICDGALFFDPVHPTKDAHRLIAEHIWKELSKDNFTFAKS